MGVASATVDATAVMDAIVVRSRADAVALHLPHPALAVVVDATVVMDATVGSHVPVARRLPVRPCANARIASAAIASVDVVLPAPPPGARVVRGAIVVRSRADAVALHLPHPAPAVVVDATVAMDATVVSHVPVARRLPVLPCASARIVDAVIASAVAARRVRAVRVVDASAVMGAIVVRSRADAVALHLPHQLHASATS